MSEILIQPEYSRVNKSGEATLVIYDHPLTDAVLESKFQVLLDGKNLGTCNTKDGFLLRVFLPLGSFKVSLRFGRVTAIETDVRVTRRGEYSLRVLLARRSLAFDEVEFYTPPPDPFAPQNPKPWM